MTSLSYQDEEKLESPFEHFLGVTCFQYLARSTTSHIVLSRWRSHEVGDARKEHPRLKQRRRRFPWIIEPRNLSQGMQPVASFPESSGFPEWRERKARKKKGTEGGGGWRETGGGRWEGWLGGNWISIEHRHGRGTRGVNRAEAERAGEKMRTGGGKKVEEEEKEDEGGDGSSRRSRR